MAGIAQSVGEGGINRDGDVRAVQALLNQRASELGISALRVDGRAGEHTIEAIRLFQRKIVHLSLPDGRVDPSGQTWRRLSDPKAASANGKLSGSAWWHANQARYPNSSDLSALDPGFGRKVEAFLKAMKQAGIHYHVRSTRRSKIRAYLMHFSWKLAHGSVRAAAIPPERGCDIVWDHGDEAKSRKAGREMVGLFQVVYQPALDSRHITGLAIDMDIHWSGPVKIVDAKGKELQLSTPSDGSNTALHSVGATYGVIKNVKDPPHWSSDGR